MVTEMRFSCILCYVSKLGDQEKQLSVSGSCETASQHCVQFWAPVYRKPSVGSAESMEMALEYAAYNDRLKAGFVHLGEE